MCRAASVDTWQLIINTITRMVNPDGSVAIGREAIGEVWAGVVGLGGRITMTTRFAVAMGDSALPSNHWSFASEQAKSNRYVGERLMNPSRR
jgi:hypothetical protein